MYLQSPNYKNMKDSSILENIEPALIKVTTF